MVTHHGWSTSLFGRLSPRIAVWHVWALSGFLVAQGLIGAVLKIMGGRQDDIAHNALHVVSGLLGLWATWVSPGASVRFARWFGGGYLLLALTGWLSPKGLAASALQLQLADQVFHSLVGAVTMAIGLACSNGAAQFREDRL